MAVLRNCGLAGVLWLLAASPCPAYILHSGTGAVSNELEDVDINPANAAFINQSKVGIKLNGLSNQTLKYRYPGAKAEIRDKTEAVEPGIGPDALPFQYLAAPFSMFSLGLMVAPPLSYNGTQKLKRLPLIVLGALDFIDVTISDIKVQSFFSSYMALKVSNTFGIGVSVRYLQASAKAEIRTSSSNAYLTSIDATLQRFSGKVAARWNILPRSLEIGFVSTLIENNTMDIVLNENLPFGIPAAQSTKGTPEVKSPIDNFTVGLHASKNAHNIYVDGERKSVDKTQTAVSLSDFKEKTRDVYNTFAIRAGYAYYLTRTWHLHGGTSYEPASIGPGSQGEDGLSGLGTLDMIPVVGLGEFIKPYREYVAGVSGHFYFGDARVKRPKGRDDLVLSVGFAYRTSSVGIDEDGEQPAAYSMRKTWIPMGATYTF